MSPLLTLAVRVNGKEIFSQTVDGPEWKLIDVDLTPYGGKKGSPRAVKGVQVDDGSWIRLKATHEQKLTLDIKLQEVAEKVFGDRRGALVAIEPASGGVLALHVRSALNVQGAIDVLEGRYGGDPKRMPFVVNKEAF